MYIKEIFMEICNWLKMNEKIIFGMTCMKHYEYIKEKNKNYEFLCVLHNYKKTYFKKYKDIKNYIYDQIKILQNNNPNKYLGKIIHHKLLDKSNIYVDIDEETHSILKKLYENKYRTDMDIIEYYGVDMRINVFQKYVLFNNNVL